MSATRDKPTGAVLLLASYCGNDNPECSDACPCLDCLKMCNILIVETGENLGGWDYNVSNARANLARAS